MEKLEKVGKSQKPLQKCKGFCDDTLLFFNLLQADTHSREP